MYAKFYVAEARINSYGVRLLCNMKLFHQAKEKEVWFLLGLPRIIVLLDFARILSYKLILRSKLIASDYIVYLLTFLFNCLKCKSFDNNITTLNIKWTFVSLLTVFSSSFWPLQCQCLLFMNSGRFITRRLANNGTDSGQKLSNYAARRGSGFNFVILVSNENNPPN